MRLVLRMLGVGVGIVSLEFLAGTLAFLWPNIREGLGGLIVVDNVVRNGAVAGAASDDPRAAGMRLFFDRVAAEPRVSATAVQTVGGKGYDGFAVALVTG